MRKGKGKKGEIVKIGRASTYTNELADFICDKIASSDKGLNIILEEENNMPSYKTVYRWLAQYEYFRQKYSRAREIQADFIADQIIEISNTPQLGEVITIKDWGKEVQIGDMLAHRRLQIDARKWKASKLNPKKYGDKVDITTGGEKLPATVIQWGDKKIQV